MRLTWLFLIMLALPFTVNADLCASWGCTSTIDEIYTTANGNVLIRTPLDETEANCTVHPGSHFVLSSTSKNFREIYSSLLTAYASDSKIQLRIVEGSPNCQISYVRLSKVL